MSDDLVKRLRDLGDHAAFEPHMHHTAADRIEDDGITIESLLKENAKLNMALNYFFLRDPDKSTSWEYSRNQAEELARSVLEPDRVEDQLISKLEKACAEWAEVSQSNYQRAKAAEAKLAKAVEALGVLADDTNWFDAIEEDGTFSPAWRGTGSPDEIARVTLADVMGGKDGC